MAAPRNDAMVDALRPRDANDVENAIQWALAEGKALEVVSGRSKRAVGRPCQTDLTLDLSALAGVTLYEPAELVLTAKAATPIAEIEALLAANNQELAFEPPDYASILGGSAAASTIGGVLAANVAGPRRLKAGAARDHFLGVSAVSGRGEAFKSGGRVVKNVTGYDMCKLLAGSWGTLAAMTEVTVKTLPRAETEATVLVLDLDNAAAMRALAAAMGSPCEISGAAHLPDAMLAVRVSPDLPVARSITALRLEGVAPSVAHRRRTLEQGMRRYGPLEAIEDERSRTFWRAIRDVAPFSIQGPSGTRALWRISTAPMNGAALAQSIAATDAELFYDWAGGLIWLTPAPSDDAGAAMVRRAVAACGGHATLIRAAPSVRAAVDVFEPQEAGLAALTRRVKESFDPKGVLNPGRMWAGV
jgi:glycolate oxidase FAD binding subunit